MTDNDIDMHVGKTLRRLRRSADMSQAELGAQMGVSFQQLQKYENGKNRISASKLYRACCVFQVLPGAFFEGLDRLGVAEAS